MRCEEKEMIQGLKDLQAYAELILYTCLPESLVQNMFSQFRELEHIFSYVFTSKDCIHTEDAILKDISKFAATRNTDNIIVIDVNENSIDNDVNAFIF